MDQKDTERGLALKIENLKKTYRRIKALKGISFDLREGELFSLLGPNGAGKTTTIRIITGLTKANGGKIWIFERDISRDEVSGKKLIGYVPQQVNLDLELTVKENLLIHGLLFRMNLKEINGRMDELLKLADLYDRRHAKVKELSGGMRRRLLIIRALFHQPKILLLDEPTVGLDPHIRRKIWHLIKQIQRDGTSILLTTHYMDEAEYLSHRVGFIFGGRILKIDTPQRLIHELGEYALEVYRKNGVETYYFKEKAEAETKMVEFSKGAESIYLRRTTLEDVFMKLIHHQG